MFAVILGAAAVRNESAGGLDAEIAPSDIPAYHFSGDPEKSRTRGLAPLLEDPSLRSSVVLYLEEEVGNPNVAKALVEAAERYGLDPALIVSLARQESGFRPRAKGVNTNGTVDRGLMQLNSSSFAFLTEREFYDPFLNADYGAAYLKHTIELSGNVVAGLAMYNAGPGRVGSLGAPRSTLDYISNIIGYQNELVRGYYDRYQSDTELLVRDFRPVKNPDLL